MKNENLLYAVKVGRQTGIFNTWNECYKVTHKYPGAKFKKFAYVEEAEAYLRGEKIKIRSKK